MILFVMGCDLPGNAAIYNSSDDITPDLSREIKVLDSVYEGIKDLVWFNSSLEFFTYDRKNKTHKPVSTSLRTAYEVKKSLRDLGLLSRKPGS